MVQLSILMDVGLCMLIVLSHTEQKVTEVIGETLRKRRSDDMIHVLIKIHYISMIVQINLKPK